MDAREEKLCEVRLAKAYMVKEKTNNFEVGAKSEVGWESGKGQAAALGFGMGELQPREGIEGSTALTQLQHLPGALVLLQHTYLSLTYSLAKTDQGIFFITFITVYFSECS